MKKDVAGEKDEGHNDRGGGGGSEDERVSDGRQNFT